MNIYNELNDKQRQAVLTDSKNIRIIAGAGSGKTKVLTTRIAHLINDLNVDERSILAITFTNKAANEMKERVNKILESESTKVTVCTIHSLCVRILRQEITNLGYPRNFTIIDSEDQKSIVKEAYKQLEIDKALIPINNTIGYISNHKYNKTDYNILKDNSDKYSVEYYKACVYEYYIERLNSMFALDFDDLLLKVEQLFKENEYVRDRWQTYYRYIHVDEFQDIDNVQYNIIKYLVGDNNSLCVVGDPDQTIYTWRGAEVSIIMNFEIDFSNVETIVLNQNYRSTSNILGAANSIIKNNNYRLDKDLYTIEGVGNKIYHKSYISEEYESSGVVYDIINKIKDGVSPKDIAILYRANHLSRSIEKALIENRIPYLIYGGVRFYERKEVKDALSYLRMLLTNDDIAFNRVINTPKRGIGDKTLESIFNKAIIEKCTMYDIICKHKISSGKVQNSIEQFINLIENIKIKSKDLSISETLELLLKDSGYLKMLDDNHEEDRKANIKELLNDINKFEEIYPNSDLDEYLQLVSLYGDKSQYESGDFVSLMTVHASKGLEFDHVYIIGLSDGIFPSQRAIEESKKGLEEERRLMYVAITRARKDLKLSDAFGFNYVLNKSLNTSRFIDEIDETLIDRQKSNNIPKQTNSYTKSKTIYSSDSEFNYVETTTTTKKQKYKKGDKVKHIMFDEGVVIKTEGDLVTIAFKYPHGVKKILSSFQGLSKL